MFLEFLYLWGPVEQIADFFHECRKKTNKCHECACRIKGEPKILPCELKTNICPHVEDDDYSCNATDNGSIYTVCRMFVNTSYKLFEIVFVSQCHLFWITNICFEISMVIGEERKLFFVLGLVHVSGTASTRQYNTGEPPVN